MDLAKSRRKEGAKDVAKDRAADLPRAFRQVTLSTHKDGSPHIVRSYRVHVADETVQVYDRYLNLHTLEKKKGELDWSRGATVTEWFYMPAAEKACGSVCLSHDEQYLQINPSWTVDIWENGQKTGAKRVSRTNFSNEMVEFGSSRVKSPNALIPRFNVTKPTEEQAMVLDLWQQEADSKDAVWIDGKSPSKADSMAQDAAYAESQRLRLLRKAQRKQPVGVAADDKGDDIEGGPKGVDELAEHH